jgi:[ribosomal protein S18]-alanine N-acetyltransferase
MRGLLFVRLAPETLDGVAAIEKTGGSAGWSRGQFEKELALPMSRFFVLQQADNILGYGGFWKVEDEAQVTNLVVAPAERRQGRGRLLLQHLLEQARSEGCRRMTLEVRGQNEAALALYRQAGFIQQTRRARAYEKPADDAVLMEKQL